MKKQLTIQASKFKAKYSHLMDKIKKNGISIIITKHGKPIAKLIPIDETPKDFFGCLKNTVNIQGDIIEPINANWENNQ